MDEIRPSQLPSFQQTLEPGTGVVKILNGRKVTIKRADQGLIVETDKAKLIINE